MKIPKFKALFFIFLSVLFLAGPANSADELLAPDQMKENLRFMKEQLLDRHPDPYHAISKEDYKKLYDELMAEFDRPMTPFEFYYIANRFVTVHDDAHTHLNAYYPREKLPLKLLWIEDGLGIINAPDEFSDLVNSRVLEINGIGLDEWLKRLDTIQNSEGIAYIREFSDRELIDQWFHAHFANDPNIKEVSIKVEKGEDTLEVSVPFVPDSEADKVLRDDFSPAIENFITIEFFDEFSAGYFKFVQCWDIPQYYERLDQFMAEVKKRGYKNLIIDLRRNPGVASAPIFGFLKHMPGERFKWGAGYDVFEKKMARYSRGKGEMGNLSYWEKPPSAKNIEPFEGNVYILISQYTFSAANQFAFVFQDNELATLVGQQTSNAPCCYGAAKHFPLPHGKFSFRISRSYFRRPSMKCNTEGVVPDVKIPLTLEDVFTGRDPVKEWLETNVK